jgi:hypothetical protein
LQASDAQLLFRQLPLLCRQIAIQDLGLATDVDQFILQLRDLRSRIRILGLSLCARTSPTSSKTINPDRTMQSRTRYRRSALRGVDEASARPPEDGERRTARRTVKNKRRLHQAMADEAKENASLPSAVCRPLFITFHGQSRWTPNDPRGEASCMPGGAVASIGTDDGHRHVLRYRIARSKNSTRSSP